LTLSALPLTRWAVASSAKPRFRHVRPRPRMRNPRQGSRVFRQGVAWPRAGVFFNRDGWAARGLAVRVLKMGATRRFGPRLAPSAHDSGMARLAPFETRAGPAPAATRRRTLLRLPSQSVVALSIRNADSSPPSVRPNSVTR
jgi:hypothetical protein